MIVTEMRTPAEATGKSFDDTTGTAGRKRTNSRMNMTRGIAAERAVGYVAAEPSLPRLDPRHV
ncbi:hypothetical protein, partial [Burkholderia cepacia]|uniref:hypothetical protein n=1 Tax=Burkholderia cepacia TaxID=292 RepID=UPI001E48A7FD